MDFIISTSSLAAEVVDSGFQNSEWQIKTWQTEDGLPENSATAMVQTPDGYLWFGTFDGLVRFDGVNFTIFNPKNTPELPSSGIVNLHLDKQGRLWISTYGGLVLHEGTHWQVLTKENVLNNEFVRTFTERDNGDLLLTKFNGDVVEFSNGRFRKLPPPPGRPSRAYLGYVDELGQWWVVQNAFIGRWDGKDWVRTISVNAPPYLVDCAKARDGGLWLRVGQELRKYSRGAEVSHVHLPEPPGTPWSMTEDSRGNFWICTIDEGVCQVSPDGRMQRWTEGHGLSYHSARFAFEDTEKDIWIGTSGGGLSRFKPRRFESFGVESGLFERVVKSVSPAPGGGLWIATYGHGLFRLGETAITNVQITCWTNYPYCQSVLTDRTGRTWLGSFGGGFCVSGTNGFERVPSEYAGGDNGIALFEDSQGRIWLSGSHGVSVYDSGTFHSFKTEQGLSPEGVSCFGEDRDNVVWSSNLRGLFRLEKDRFVEVTDKNNHSVAGIDCILCDADNCLWLGLVSDGLLRYRNGSFSRIDHEAGLPVNTVNGIIEDNAGFFWLASNRGVVHVRRNDLESAADGRGSRFTCQLLDLSDGAPSVEFSGGTQPSCAKDSSGRLWFATLKGIAMIDPSRFKINPRPPPVRIEEVVYHTSSEPGAEQAKTERHSESPIPDRLTLPAGSRNIEIHYTALNFTSPEKVHFQIRLRGRWPEWQDVGNRRVAYFDELQPGENVFQVRAANDDGVWNETGASLAFALAPLFWQTAWFRAIMWVAVVVEGILILALVRAMLRRRRARLELRERLNFEQLLSELSRVFINLPSEKLAAQIREALRRVGEYLKFDVAVFSTFADSGKEGRAFYLWRSPAVKEIACDRIEKDLPWSANELMQGRDVWLPGLSNLPPEAEPDRATFINYGLRSSYQVPLYSSGSVIACLALCSVRERRELTRELLQRQRLIGEVFVNALTRKLAEDHQRESEVRFRIVADSAPVMIWMSGVDKLCTFFNKTWLNFTGRTLEQEFGNGWVEGVHRADLEECLRSYMSAFDSRKQFILHYRLRRHDGEYRWISDNGVPRYDAKGDFAGYIGSCVDVTERQEAQERMSLAAEAANLGMWIWDIQLGRVWTTEKFRQLFGFVDGEDVTQERIQARIHPQDRERRSQVLQRAVETGGSYDIEYRLVRTDGEERWLSSKGHAEKDEQGQPARVLGVYIDITERRRAASEVQNLRQELAHFSRVSIIGQLASALAHELNQPLGAILRNAEAAELFLENPKPDLEELRNIITDIRKDDQRAGGVIDRLRLLLKRREIEMQELDAAKLADEVLILLRSDALGRRVAMELEASPGLPLVLGDRVQLQQVLLNLSINAMDAVIDCPPERRRVRLQVGRESDKFVAFAVGDHGSGIPADKLKSIFEPFFTTKAHGMGLGLSICRTIVEAHGGRISAQNSPEGGAIFRFTVPAANHNGNVVKVE